MTTRPTDSEVDAFLGAIEDEEKRADCLDLARMMREVTGAEPRLWGSGMVGFGSYHYRYQSGREGDWFLTGFAPRKKELTVYIVSGFDRHGELMRRLGTYKTGKSCLYIKRLADVDVETLRELVRQSVAHVRETYGADGG